MLIISVASAPGIEKFARLLKRYPGAAFNVMVATRLTVVVAAIVAISSQLMDAVNIAVLSEVVVGTVLGTLSVTSDWLTTSSR